MKIAVALSGGVDSSVSAYLLKQAGHDVFGLFMKNWEEKDASGHCLAEKDYEDVIKVCETLDIPYYGINFAEEYWNQVFTHFLDEIKQGYTPNPDILCNREIKFNVLYKKALALGADALTTGHYCQTSDGQLLKGKDSGKDQSYFLYTIKSDILRNVQFPIGHMLKPDVRKLAHDANIPVFDKKDSTGICFIGKRNFKEFLENYIPKSPGHFETLDGKVIGTHEGAVYYTIGQRKGMGIGGPGDAWFVVGKDIERNVVLVAQGSEHPALFSYELFATDISWVHSPPTEFPFTCKAKIRYRQQEEPCVIESVENGKMHVTFPQPMRAITPRQSVVFYDGDTCLGGALIEKAGPSLYSLHLQ
ncbi:tRNA-specific 2-thiouridylase mnmA [Simkania negevensis Z]|uniref:tRNA-specific 2-thiouridylase MnmA n=1 Tax=Simkania negevensis (strain ATCC VR-1471 / DSM 27360 / Z) TaxID=331113 RepID=F8L8S4_SIMNZ|nr:tRNA-specific 2-thiouridylase mnmA [Simkania negevensis Z]